MKKILVIIRSLISYMLLMPVLLFTALPAFILLLILPERYCHDNRLYFWFIHQSFDWALRILFVPIKVVGKKNIPKKSAIIIANHQSVLDIPLLGSLTGYHPHVWLAWFNLVRFPVLGFFLRRMAVLVDMSSPQRGARSLIQALNRLKNNGRHVLLFPEGARFVDGKIHDFFSGFVILARKTGYPVVPVLLVNAAKVYPPGSFLIHWHKMQIIVGEPFVLQDNESDQEFNNRVRQWFIDMNSQS